MCLGLNDTISLSETWRNWHLHQYRLTPSETVNSNEQYRLDHSQIIFDQHKLEITGSQYPSITKYDNNNNYHAFYYGHKRRLDELKLLYQVISE